MSASHTRTPVEVVVHGGVRRTIVDLSDVLSNATADFEPLPHTIEYMTAEEGAERPFFGLEPEHWPGRAAMAGEIVNLATHAGTHVDAPYHYGPAVSGAARTIEQVPLSWLFGPGVVLDVRDVSRLEGVRRPEVEAELERIGHELEAGDVVLVWTGTNLKEPGYDLKHPGLRRDATEYLVDRGVRLIGIDAWGLDRPFDVMAEEAKAGDTAQLWESHVLGRSKEYCQIERLANLELLPRPIGFTVYAFPYLVEGASAGWTRVVAIFEEPA
jgi:kynurenine formamidase